jgi:hypothetical protein
MTMMTIIFVTESNKKMAVIVTTSASNMRPCASSKGKCVFTRCKELPQAGLRSSSAYELSSAAAPTAHLEKHIKMKRMHSRVSQMPLTRAKHKGFEFCKSASKTAACVL